METPVISGPLLKKQHYSLDKVHTAQAEKKPQLGLLVYRTTYTQRSEKAPIEFDDLLHFLHSFYVILVEERKRRGNMLANQIVFLRKRAGMSQLQLAQELNVGPSAVGMYEQGRRTPSVDILIDMANFFDVSLDYLITGTESPHTVAGIKDSAWQSCCPHKVCGCCFHQRNRY